MLNTIKKVVLLAIALSTIGGGAMVAKVSISKADIKTKLKDKTHVMSQDEMVEAVKYSNQGCSSGYRINNFDGKITRDMLAGFIDGICNI